MCGVFAAFNIDRGLNKDHVLSASSLLNHRGPDNQDFAFREDGKLFLHHSRLKIVDLDDASNQPFCSPDGRYTLIFNGEIYNYRSLRNQIGNKWQWETNSDTEVILAYWSLYQHESIHMLNGMFAFIIYDKYISKLTIVRDRFGIKPLYYFHQKDAIYFSSEIKPLLKFVPKVAENKDILRTYLETGYYDHSNETFFKDIYSLDPGSYIHLDLKKLNFKKVKWYEFTDNIRKNLGTNIDDLREEAEFLILDSIKSHLVADVNVGLNISGGVDSSMLVKGALKQDQYIKLFNQDYEHYSELKWVKQVAENYPLFSEKLGFQDIDNVLNKTVKLQEEPFGGVMVCGYNYIYRCADQNDTTVLLDGNGVDEIFLGYKKYHQYFTQIFNPKNKNIIHDFERFWKTKFSPLKDNSSIDGTFGIAPECISENLRSSNIIGLDMQDQTNDPVKNLAIRDLLFYKIPRGLRFNDRISMNYSKELRVPFLDHKLAEFALGLPIDLLINEKGTKVIFRDILAKNNGESIAYANKRSVQSPQREWIGNEWADKILAILKSESFNARGWVNQKRALEKYERYLSGKQTNSFFVWQWFNLELWAREFLD